MIKSSAFSADRICLLLEEDGFRAQLEHVNDEFWSINSGAHGHSFRILLLVRERKIVSVSFSIFRSADEADVTLRKINHFNSETLIARAYRDEDDDLNIRANVPIYQADLNDQVFLRFFASWLADVELAAKLII